MRKILQYKFLFIWFLPVLILLCAVEGYYAKNAACMSVNAETYIVVNGGGGYGLQSSAIKKAMRIAMKKAAENLAGRNNVKSKDAGGLLETELYPYGSKYVYSFKIISAGKYLNLYYINIKAYIRKEALIRKLKRMGFKITGRPGAAKQRDYNIYYVKFIGNFKYSDSNKFQKLMIKYSTHLKDLYVSSFSDNFAEIKILYYGGIVRLLKRARPLLESYLKAKIYTVKNGVIIVDVE